MRKSTTSTQLQFSLVFLLIAILATVCHGQENYKVLAFTHAGTTMKFPAKIEINDSTFIMSTSEGYETKMIQNRAGHIVYLTDGTALDKLTIAAIPGRAAGIKYDYLLRYDTDTRFGGTMILYYCIKEN